MDAQNAARPDKTKPAPAAAASDSNRRPDHVPDHKRPATSASAKPAIAASKPTSNADKDAKTNASPSADAGDDRGTVDGASSDAETIVLPGKDGHSPSKVRKVKHENKSDDDMPSIPRKHRDRDREHVGSRDREREKDRERERDRSTTVGASTTNSAAPSPSLKKKRLPDRVSDNKPSLPAPGQRNKDVSVSAPTSPPAKRRRSDANAPSHPDSDSDNPRHRSPKLSKDRTKADKLIPHKRKAPKVESEDEEEQRKARRQRTAPASTGPSGADPHTQKHGREVQRSSKPFDQTSAHGRSVSPHPRPHRRSASTQLPAQSTTGLSQKKKRVPAPLQSTEYHSDESSTSGSPHPRSSKFRNLATPATADSNISPAKMAPHKKHLDAHGQTFLARACARGEYEQAKQRLAERPEDLNVADYAGNTPLQIAAINGCEDIVQLLIEAGCNLDCVNYDKDTPLLDAVDNGHLRVIKLLLDAGVNPRKANVNGEEPIDRVNDEMDNAGEIRTLLTDARQRIGDRRRTSEEHHTERAESRPSHGPESPRQSPVPSSHLAAAASGRRNTNVRSTKTSNHLLYMPMDDKTLRQAAGRGDEETVTRILQVRDGCDDPEAMVNAARGGHDLVMQLLLALGGANPDPPPVTNVAPDVATPMLAAIGQENIKVIQLLLDQNNFDPTRRFKGDTYYEIARRRAGPNWKEEEHILQRAYEEYKKSRTKDSSKKSPSRREREKEREEREIKRANRNEAREESTRSLKNTASSPPGDTEPKKKLISSKTTSSPKDKKRTGTEPASRHDDHTSPKRGPGRPKKEDRVPSITVSDRENSPAVHKQTKAKRTESDLAAVSSEGESAKPRRKLISKGELRSEREKHRRTSQVSTGSSIKDPASPQESRTEDQPEKEKVKGEKYHDRTKAIKRDESKDRLSVSGDNSSKRHRSSATPPHSVSGDKDDTEVPAKRRRLDPEGKERRPKLTATSAEDRPAKSSLSREQSLARSMKSSKVGTKIRDDEDKELKAKKALSDPHRRESAKSTSSEKSIHVKYEDADVDMADAPPAMPNDGGEAKPGSGKVKDGQPNSQDKKRPADDADIATNKEDKKRRDVEEKERERKKRREEEEAKRKEEEERKRRAEDEKERKRKAEEEQQKKKVEEEERKRKEEEERKKKQEEEEQRRKKQEEEEQRKRKQEEEERKKKQEEERKKKQEEEERKKKEEEERLRKEAEERKKREEEEEKRREEEERKRREEEEERKRKLEEERKRKEEEERRRKEEEDRKRKEEELRKQREEEERLRREQLEREVEAARRKREEEERREREHRERQRAAREAEQRRLREEQERVRLAKLPPLLRWLDACPNPKSGEVAQKFKKMQGIRYDTIRPEATGAADGREQWVLNTQVALLLGEKDLSLSRCTLSPSCRHIP